MARKGQQNYNPLLKSYPDSEKINSVSEGAECLYTRLIAQSDDGGCYLADPRFVLAKLFTHRMLTGLTAEMVGERIAELYRADLIRLYVADGKQFLQLVDVFKTFRSDRTPKYVHPQPVTEPDPYSVHRGNSVFPVVTAVGTVCSHPMTAVDPEPDPYPEPDQDPEPKPEKPAASQPSPSKPAAVDLSDQVRRVFEHYRAWHPKRFPRVHSGLKEWGLVRARLVDGYTVEALCEAIDGNRRSAWHQGGNPDGKFYDTLGLIVRTAGHVDQFRAVPARAGPVLNAKNRQMALAAGNLIDREFGSEHESEVGDGEVFDEG